MVLGAAEHGVRDVHTWPSAENRYWASYGMPLAARYLAWLAEHTDYPLSDIEAEVAAHATSQPASGSNEPAGEARRGAAQPADADPVSGSGETESEWDSADQEQTHAPTETS